MSRKRTRFESDFDPASLRDKSDRVGFMGIPGVFDKVAGWLHTISQFTIVLG
jgi:hypothetical protein